MRACRRAQSVSENAPLITGTGSRRTRDVRDALSATSSVWKEEMWGRIKWALSFEAEILLVQDIIEIIAVKVPSLLESPPEIVCQPLVSQQIFSCMLSLFKCCRDAIEMLPKLKALCSMDFKCWTHLYNLVGGYPGSRREEVDSKNILSRTDYDRAGKAELITLHPLWKVGGFPNLNVNSTSALTYNFSCAG